MVSEEEKDVVVVVSGIVWIASMYSDISEVVSDVGMCRNTP